MRRTIVLFTLVIVSLASLAAAQEPPKNPTADHQKLAYFVGKWTTTADMKPSPMGPGGKMTSSDSCEWFEGKFFVVCHYSGTSPMGPTKGIGLMGYSMEEKAYTYYGIDNSAMAMGTVPKGTIQGDTWTYNDESLMGGQKVKSRYVLKISSPTSYTFKWEMQGKDGKWMTMMEGTSTKKGTT